MNVQVGVPNSPTVTLADKIETQLVLRRKKVAHINLILAFCKNFDQNSIFESFIFSKNTLLKIHPNNTLCQIITQITRFIF